ncbi:MAG: Glutamyl-tRNA(Gln) amidotransferase subunit A [Candidatus Nomurabacteria bacterium GW2011_GWB1_37_5]|uniref:Glutamyl-tRNA(Gln) amidotransferase subunit A n=1 Tax=Candidatus Nomurabacteria bacterium GW2011_GWB1_37_5 TaxID=1618742 RepID=A0A0G0GVI5_9BACT|nr:MAG: Glutamyl-tRNA(Gln) amidotransferase subunit A [Candidatus Nomurabacteria bacterium GW2011_GWB1_37_5]
MDLKSLTIEKTHESLKKGEFTVADLALACLKEIEKKNKDLNAYLEVFNDVMEQARQSQKMFEDGSATLLTGIPFAIKDNILIEGRRAGAASKILEGYRAVYDATVIKKLKTQGVVFLGRTNMDEFAMGSSTENSAYGVTKNPHDPSRVAGGSSGGSAAAVAMDGAMVALGSDTGGSVRQPAAFCGVVGLKPTYGALSRYGLMAMGSSLDQIGPFTKTVRDAEIIFQAVSEHDPMDSTSVPENIRYDFRQRSRIKDQGSKIIGVPRNFLNHGGIDKETLDNFEKSLIKLESLGYKVVNIDLPLVEYSLPAYYIIMPAESSSNLSRFDGVRYGLQEKGTDLLDTYKKTKGKGFGKEVRRRIMLGTYVLSHGYYDAYYNKAIKLRNQIEKDFGKVFEEVDAIVTPTTPAPAFKIGEKAKDPLAMYLSDIFTVSANIAGVPAISIPAGVNKDGLPLDLHLMAPHFREDVLFEIGKKFEM